MKLLLVSPPLPEPAVTTRLSLAPAALEYLAGMTSTLVPSCELELFDAARTTFAPDAVDADLVGFSVMTPQAPWTYTMAARLQRRGIKVILGGAHVTACPDEAALFSDAAVLGEAESVWSTLLHDAEYARLEPTYHGTPSPLTALAHPKTDLLDPPYRIGAFFTARGCQHTCTFCAVPQIAGGHLRYRPVGEVVAEVAASTRRVLHNLDNNVFGPDPRRCIELYRAIAAGVRRRWWFGSANLAGVTGAEGSQVLSWARRAGCFLVVIGWESNNISALQTFRAVGKQGQNRLDAVRKIRDYGIDVVLSFVVGSRVESSEELDDIRELCFAHKIAAWVTMVTPYPGTELYHSYHPYLINGLDWDSFDGNHAVFSHPATDMGAEQRETALHRLRADLSTMPHVLSRLPRISWRGFPTTHLLSWLLQHPLAREYRHSSHPRARRL